jgi:peptidoglycan-associated lipoprotein
MFRRSLLLTAVLLSVAACSTTDDTADMGEISVEERQDITAGPLDGTQVMDRGYVEQGPAPGTQQDLVVNVGDRVFYGFDSYELTIEAQQILQRQAEWLRRHAFLTITVEGHADERGTREYNLALGERRANAVKNYLTALGIDSNRISTISYGKERPAVVGSGDAVWSQNRRGVTIVD